MKFVYTISKILSNFCYNLIYSRNVIGPLPNHIVQLSAMNQMQIVYRFVMDFFFSQENVTRFAIGHNPRIEFFIIFNFTC
jgi:hypothetical protein